MTSMAQTLTLPGAIPTYEYEEHVKCRGWHHGAPCGKVLAKNLQGSVSLKCTRCAHIETYQNKTVDNSA